MDPFVIYNDLGYSHTRVDVSNAAYGRQLPRLVESTRVIFLSKKCYQSVSGNVYTSLFLYT